MCRRHSSRPALRLRHQENDVAPYPTHFPFFQATTEGDQAGRQQEDHSGLRTGEYSGIFL
jgi:hypothetical protein